MWQILSWSFWKDDRSIENGTYDDLNAAEDSCEQLISEIFNNALLEAQTKTWKVIDLTNALRISSEITQEMSHLWEDIVGSPTEVDYDSNHIYRIALFKQRLEEWRYKEKLLEIFER